MRFFAALKRPEYIFRPTQIVRRLMCEIGPVPAEHDTVRLPWGLKIRVQPNETIGSGIRRLGIHELASSECISRLVDPEDLAVDVGANIGHMTSIMAMRAGPRGEVIAFEPHPVLFRELQFNVAEWRRDPLAAPITELNLALSDHTGFAKLTAPSGFNHNNGTSFLVSDAEAAQQTECYEVPLKTLDSIVNEGQTIGFLKIDVEGHELHVLKGARGLLSSGRIRDILFEDHGTPPTPVTQLLKDNGYTLYRVDGALMGPVAISPIETPYTPIANDAPNYLATRNPARLSERIAKRGWMVYSAKWH
jgi:FkbM family methyltransferase